jgi:holliday junction DNA helicase RuvA
VISTLRGPVTRRVGADVIVEVGGIGYSVTVPDRVALRLREGEEVFLHTAFIVREDLVALFGFETPEELDMFDLLRSVSGVGPKSAMAVLGHLSADEIHDAVASENDGVFRAVSGIGPKTAKLIVLSLQGALERRPPRTELSSGSPRVSEVVKQSVVQALVGLGWSDRVAKSGVAQALEDSGTEPVDAQTLLRQTLTILGPHTNREGTA